MHEHDGRTDTGPQQRLHLHIASCSKKQQFCHLQLNIISHKHRFVVHFSDSYVNVRIIVRMGFADWRGGTTDLCPRRQKPSRCHWKDVSRTSGTICRETVLMMYLCHSICGSNFQGPYKTHNVTVVYR